jgi:CheY-like chemotaxis protein
VCEDITARKLAETDLLRAQKLEAVGVLAGGIAHDFNNLLTAILGNISTVKRSLAQDDNIHKRLADAEKASLMARELTRQFLTFSKGGAPIKKTASIGDLIRESAILILRGSDVNCIFSIDGDLWPVQADEGQINQVINNLVINAVEAMPGGGSIHIKAENFPLEPESGLPLKGGDYVKISVKDQGSGIPEDAVEKIFDPYFTTKPTGTGLGLSTSYSIVKNHNGYIGVESRPGLGTVFSIYLPASEDNVVAAKIPDLPVPGKGRVLVMDDEKIIRTAAGLMLKDLGYSAEFARDGQEAVETYKKAKELKRPFDAVIIDLTVRGGMGGKETIKKLVEIDPGIKAIVSSGYSKDPIMANYSQYGFCGVVEKPYTLNELSHVLHRVISPST